MGGIPAWGRAFLSFPLSLFSASPPCSQPPPPATVTVHIAPSSTDRPTLLSADRKERIAPSIGKAQSREEEEQERERRKERRLLFFVTEVI